MARAAAYDTTTHVDTERAEAVRSGKQVQAVRVLSSACMRYKRKGRQGLDGVEYEVRAPCSHEQVCTCSEVGGCALRW